MHALDGRDGAERWTWRSGVGEGDHKVHGGIDAIALDHEWKDSVCVTYSDLNRRCRIVILDAQGQERARRVLPPESSPGNMRLPVADYVLDLDGDGRDEVLLSYDNRLRVWGCDLKDRWSIPAQDWNIFRVLPASPGGSRTLFLPPSRAVDGKSGQVLWTYKPGPTAPRYGGDLLATSDPTEMPRLICIRSTLVGTVCRCALPAAPRGDYAPASGRRPPAGLARDDPRWTRPLPWTDLVRPRTVRTGLLAVIGLALVNVFLPLGILRFAAGRRRFSLPPLMALPVAAAVPLSVFLTVEPMLPVPAPSWPLAASPMAVFALSTLAGVPIVAFGVLAVWSLLRRRWRVLGVLAGIGVLASLAIAAVWIRVDMRNMPAIEHYSRSGWYVVILPGGMIASVLVLGGLAIKRMTRWIRWRVTRAT